MRGGEVTGLVYYLRQNGEGKKMKRGERTCSVPSWKGNEYIRCSIRCGRVKNENPRKSSSRKHKRGSLFPFVV